MNLKSIYFITGYLSVLIGVCAAVCMYKIQHIFLGICISILGFIVSGINIYIKQNYFYDLEKYPKGYLGMVFSSLPVLFMLFVIFKFRH